MVPVSKNSTMSLQARYALRRVALLARVLLHCSVVFVLALCPCATPSLGLINVAESEAPADQDESSLTKEAISSQCRAGVVRNQSSSPFAAPLRGGVSLAAAKIAGHPHTGHRLSNNLLAPLRC